LFKDDGLLTTDDLIVAANGNSSTPPVLTRTLTAGKYIVAVTRCCTSTAQIIAGTYTHNSPGDYELAVVLDESSQPFPASKNLTGYAIDLDAADAAGPYYEIVGQNLSQLIVASPTPITLVAPGVQELIGVTRLQGLDIGPDTQVQTSDRILITDPNGLQGGLNSLLRTDYLINPQNLALPPDLVLDVTGTVTP